MYIRKKCSPPFYCVIHFMGVFFKKLNEFFQANDVIVDIFASQE
jgi:hypothetical protein